MEHGVYIGYFNIYNSETQKLLRTIRVILSITTDISVDTPEYPSIQSGIDASIDGDVVIVPAGEFTGSGNTNINLRGKAIDIKSTNGPGLTIINGGGVARGFYMLGGGQKPCTIEGFTIKNCIDTVLGVDLYAENMGGSGILINTGTSKIINCNFVENLVSANNLLGSAVCIWGDNAEIAKCVFNSNAKSNQGKVSSALYIDGSYSTVSECDFIGNKSYGPGGALSIGNTASVNNVITNCKFQSNVSTSNSGGAIRAIGDSKIAGCTFLSNSATGSGAVGGAVYHFLPSNSSANCTIANCVFVGNSAKSDGGAFYLSEQTGTKSKVYNCTILQNNGGTGYGGIRIASSAGGAFDIQNNIVRDNSPLSLSQISATGTLAGINDYNNANGLTNLHNIGTDPQFIRNPSPGADTVWGTADDDYGDLRLLANSSPCIDAGTVIEDIFSDIRGSLRPIDGPDGGGKPSGIDMGSYEHSAYYGGSASDTVTKAFKELTIKSSVVVTGFEYMVEWKDKDPFPSDPRISSPGEYSVNLALVSAHGRRIDLGSYTVEVMGIGHSVPITFGTEHVGRWQIRLELSADPNQFVLSSEIPIEYRGVDRYAFGQWIRPPTTAYPGVKPDIDQPDLVYWSNTTKRLYAVAPGTTVITWYEDPAAQEASLPKLPT